MLDLASMVKNFDFKNITGAVKVSVEFKESINIGIEFKYEDFLTNISLLITIQFENCRSQTEDWPSLVDILEINCLSVENISNRGWENLYWAISDQDDDGDKLFKFYCKEIKLLRIVNNCGLLIYENTVSS